MPRQDGLDPQTRELVRFAASIAQGDEPDLRERVRALRVAAVPVTWVEELLLQSVLFCGYPRALVATAVWRKFSGVRAPEGDAEAGYDNVSQWLERGERTCAIIYGDNYRRLRENIKQLHPALDEWMIAEGYGRTLSRPGLDLLRRELCTVAQTAFLETPKQLHSHLQGAIHAGATPEQVDGALAVVNPMLSFDAWKRVKELWRAVRDGLMPEN